MTINNILLIILYSFSAVLYAQEPTPNIIFILTDDQRWDALGYAGNEIIQTPEMDKLASEGSYFKNAFVTTPICAASRASIMTGTYERKHRYTFQQPPLSNELIDNSYFSILKEAGYYSGFLGKFGVNFQNRRDTALFDVYKPEQRNFYYRLANGGTTHKHLTDIIGENAVDFIKTAPKDKPFCLSISYHAPHAEDYSPDQYIWPQELDALYKDVIIPDPLISDAHSFDKLPVPVKEGFNRTRWQWRYDHPDKYQEMVKGYYRMITGIDRTIKEIRAALDQHGVAENTIIILMGDNGYFLGERQLAGKWLMYEQSLRVPLIIYSPMGAGHQIIEDMALNVDITPTILDFANISIPDSYQGRSLVDYTYNQASVETKRDYFLCEHLWDFDPIPPSEGVRSERYKYFRYIDDSAIEEFYDIVKDPLEENNLVNDPALREILNVHRLKCDELIGRMSD